MEVERFGSAGQNVDTKGTLLQKKYHEGGLQAPITIRGLIWPPERMVQLLRSPDLHLKKAFVDMEGMLTQACVQ